MQSRTSGSVLWHVVYQISTVPTEYVLLRTWNCKTFASIYQDVPGLYLVCTWYILVRTRINQKMNVHNIENQTVDLMHSILCAIPLHYQSAFHGVIYGYYKLANKTY